MLCIFSKIIELLLYFQVRTILLTSAVLKVIYSNFRLLVLDLSLFSMIMY